MNDDLPRVYYPLSVLDELRERRAQVDDYRMMIDGLEKAAHEERAAVVAWLRKCEQVCREDAGEDAVSWAYHRSASAIERGDHRRKEQP